MTAPHPAGCVHVVRSRGGVVLNVKLTAHIYRLPAIFQITTRLPCRGGGGRGTGGPGGIPSVLEENTTR